MMAVIMVVDDERPVREFLAQALENNGYRVLQAFNGRHALHVIANVGSDGPDLIISDVMMPLVGGVELCRAVKCNPKTADIPVILMSAGVQRASLKANADGFIAKPFDLDTIDVLISSVLARHESNPD
jgi:CheY-like chemotaxis protein